MNVLLCPCNQSPGTVTSTGARKKKHIELLGDFLDQFFSLHPRFGIS